MTITPPIIMETLPCLTIAAHFCVSFVTTALVYRHVLRICIEKDITDKPCSRKLQQTPVPVLGGVAVFVGMLAAMIVGGIISDISRLYPVVCIMTLMLCVGVTDDILGLTPVSRIAVEVAAVLALVYATGCSIDDFHGLWGIGQLPGWLSVCLTVFAGVGIINSVNLIDGVNGLCSGYCIFACSAFGVYSLLSGDNQTATLAAVCIGALLPFLCHNVFGQTSKMFIGNGGTMLMGTVMVFFVISRIHGAEMPSEIPFTLAVLSIPVFDTVRVMGVRMLKGRSPFSPDKGHLHHLLFTIHFSHVGTTLTEILFGTTVTVAWWVSNSLGVPADVQLYIVMALGFCFTSGIYALVEHIQKHCPKLFATLCRLLGDLTHFGHSRWWLKIGKVMDR